MINRIGLSYILIQIFLISATGQETIVKYLSGKGEDNTVDWEFFVTEGRKSGEWTTIPVPSNWELEGFGNYNYGHDYKTPEKVHKEQGLYKHTFDVPRIWKGKEVSIVFEGSMTDTEVKINGKSAGPVHQGSFYQFSYNISDLVKYGEENLLEVTVSKHSANESVNMAERKADYWVFGGIFRPVYLEVKPRENIDWTAIDAKATGDFYIDIYTSSLKMADKITAQIKTLGGKPIGSPFSVDTEKKKNTYVLTTKIDNPETWSPEYPNLYKVDIQISNNDEPLHQVTETFGFRTVEFVAHDGIYINDKKIKFKGVNRHSFWPSSGRTTSEALTLADINLIKDMNMNAVRMSHYPPDKHFLEACDSIGIFVLNELAGWQSPPYDTDIAKRLIKQIVKRDVNHPSIVIWDNGNEGGNNTAVDDDFAKYDPQNRPVIHPFEIFRNFDTQHYKSYNFGAGTFYHGNDVFFPTEFLHGLYDGGHGAGLEDHWEVMQSHPLSAGMFLWVFSDEAVVRTDKDGMLDTDGNHAPDGIVGPYREKEGSFYTIKEIWSPVHIPDIILSYKFDGTIPVENRYFYTNLEDCSFKAEITRFDVSKSASGTVIEPVKVEWPALEPGNKGKLALQLPENWQNFDALYLTAYDPHGRKLYKWSFPATSPGEKALEIIAAEKSEITAEKANISEQDNTLVLKSSGTEIYINKQTGLLEKVIANGNPISLENGPVLNDENPELDTLYFVRTDSSILVNIRYKGEGRFLNTTWNLLNNGILRGDFAFTDEGQFDFYGISFNYPEENVSGMEWLGDGPYRVWKNRLRGPRFDLWEKDYNNAVTGESWEYPEFKGYHSNLYWVKVKNTEQPFTVTCATPGIFLHMLTPEEPKGAGNDNTSPAFPKGNLSFLSGISPIGTKFKRPEEHGPMGRKTFMGYQHRAKPYTITLYFDFHPQ